MTAATQTKRPEIMPPLEEDYELLKSAVRKAGALANSYFTKELEVHKKPDGSVSAKPTWPSTPRSSST